MNISLNSSFRQSLWSSIVVEDLDSGKNIRMNIFVELNRCGAIMVLHKKNEY